MTLASGNYKDLTAPKTENLYTQKINSNFMVNDRDHIQNLVEREDNPYKNINLDSANFLENSTKNMQENSNKDKVNNKYNKFYEDV